MKKEVVFYISANLLHVWILITGSAFILLEYVVLIEEHEDSLPFHREGAGKFLRAEGQLGLGCWADRLILILNQCASEKV